MIQCNMLLKMQHWRSTQLTFRRPQWTGFSDRPTRILKAKDRRHSILWNPGRGLNSLSRTKLDRTEKDSKNKRLNELVLYSLERWRLREKAQTCPSTIIWNNMQYKLKMLFDMDLSGEHLEKSGRLSDIFLPKFVWVLRRELTNFISTWAILVVDIFLFWNNMASSVLLAQFCL